MNKVYLLLVLLGIFPIILIISYSSQINSFFGTTTASNYLLIGLIVVDLMGNFLVYYLGKRDEKTKRSILKIFDRYKQTGGEETTIRLTVENKGGSTARECYGLIGLDYTKDDVVKIGGYPTLIEPDNFTKLDADDLCWSKNGNPPQINIPKGGKGDLEICRLVKKTVAGTAIVIPSDQGWGSLRYEDRGGTHTSAVPDTYARISLKAKNYKGALMIGADNAEQQIVATFHLIYDEKTQMIDLKLLEIP